MSKYSKTVFFCFSVLFLAVSVFPGSSWAQPDELTGITLDEKSFTLDDEWDINEEPLTVYDPYEGYNRFMFNVNDKIYRFFFKPISKGYDFLVPRKIQGSINNFVRLTGTPQRFLNNLFQKKPKSAIIEFGRLLINSTIGIGGLFDPADRVFGLKQQTEDFGQTLGYYGVKAGPYIIWPIIGPSTRRDVIGFAVDYAFDPFTWLSIYHVDPEDGFLAIRGVRKANNYTYNTRDSYERIVESAIDPYIALQNAFIQNREKMIKE